MSRHRTRPRERQFVSPPPMVEAEALAYLAQPNEAIAGNSVELLAGGDEAYPRMLEAIGAARRAIWLEVFEYSNDRIGRLFCDALCERAKAGVDVRVCVDAWGAVLTSSGPLLNELRAAGVKVSTVFDLHPWQRAWRWFQRDHRKLLVVDHRIAFTGGLNIGLAYAGPKYGGRGWKDLQVVVRGPAVLPLARLFVKLWRRNGGEPINDPPHSPVAGEQVVRVLANHLSRSRKEIRQAYLHALRRATRSVTIANAYFLPGPRIIAALIRALNRGVKVTLILPGHNDVPAFQNASRALYRRLLAAGARIFETRGSMLHAKAAMVDGLWCTVGSCNLDAWSLHRNLELNVAVLGPHMSDILGQYLNGLLGNCDEITYEVCRGWSWGRRLLNFVCLLLFMPW